MKEIAFGGPPFPPELIQLLRDGDFVIVVEAGTARHAQEPEGKDLSPPSTSP